MVEIKAAHISLNKDFCTIVQPKIQLYLHDLLPKLRTSSDNQKLSSIVASALEKAREVWQPKIIYRWFQVQELLEESLLLYDHADQSTKIFNLGYSGCFLQGADQVLISAYTTGCELENYAKDAYTSRRFLDSWIYEVISLSLLEKLGKYVNEMVEHSASKRCWGVTPILSPGSVHGWQLSEQQLLCSLLPLHKIGIEVSKIGVLKPSKSLCFLIGVGQKFKERSVGTPCKVCINKNSCAMIY